MILEVRHLRVVQAIVREGSVTKAAESLYLTQPAVSHTLKDIESRLGVQLFRRNRKRMEPTPEGLSLQATAERVLNELECAEESLQSFKAGKRGVLRVATQCYTCYHWLPRILKRFEESVPAVDLQIVPEATNEPVEALLGEVEIGFGVKGGNTAGQDFINRAQFMSHLANVGDARTLIIHPASTTHRQLSEEQQQAAGVTPDMVRISVGLETLDDILWDIDQALSPAS